MRAFPYVVFAAAFALFMAIFYMWGPFGTVVSQLQAGFGWMGLFGYAMLLTFAASVLFSVLLRPRKRVEVRSYGMVIGFLVALFAEMYGFPLLFYVSYAALGGSELSYAHQAYVQSVGKYAGNALIFLGIILVGIGWAKIYNRRGRLVTDGIYKYSRNPQYVGILLFSLGFAVQYPLLLSIALFPVLVLLYYTLARREERDLRQEFGREFEAYRARTRMFV